MNTEVSLLGQGFVFLIVGMGIVFAFLTLQVYVMKLTSHLLGRFLPAGSAPADKATDSKTDEELAVAIAVAASRRVGG